MHGANHYYGHAHVLAKYTGLSLPFTIWGYLQHGWNILDGFAVGTRFTPGLPLFVWSDEVVRRGWTMGRRNYQVMGAAWCYLLEMTVNDDPAAPRFPRARFDSTPPQRSGTLFYPFHGWEGQQVLGDHAALLARLQEVETGPITVCLYWAEYDDPAIRAVYERAGCRVITHGYRGFAYNGTDPRFLFKQLDELRRHERVVSNRLSSAILYGASVGCEVGVYGDPMVLDGEDPAFGGVARQRRLWPELHQEHVPTPIAAEFAHAELGSRHVRSPEELRDLFDWPSRPRRKHA